MRFSFASITLLSLSLFTSITAYRVHTYVPTSEPTALVGERGFALRIRDAPYTNNPNLSTNTTLPDDGDEDCDDDDDELVDDDNDDCEEDDETLYPGNSPNATVTISASAGTASSGLDEDEGECDEEEDAQITSGDTLPTLSQSPTSSQLSIPTQAAAIVSVASSASDTRAPSASVSDFYSLPSLQSGAVPMSTGPGESCGNVQTVYITVTVTQASSAPTSAQAAVAVASSSAAPSSASLDSPGTSEVSPSDGLNGDGNDGYDGDDQDDEYDDTPFCDEDDQLHSSANIAPTSTSSALQTGATNQPADVGDHSLVPADDDENEECDDETEEDDPNNSSPDDDCDEEAGEDYDHSSAASTAVTSSFTASASSFSDPVEAPTSVSSAVPSATSSDMSRRRAKIWHG